MVSPNPRFWYVSGVAVLYYYYVLGCWGVVVIRRAEYLLFRTQLYINCIADRLVQILQCCLWKRSILLITGELSDSLGSVLRRWMISALWCLVIVHMLRTPYLINLHIQHSSLSLCRLLLSWFTLISLPWSSDSGRHQLSGVLRVCISEISSLYSSLADMKRQ